MSETTATGRFTSGPWQVIEDRYEDDGKSGKLTGRVAQRRIFTAWDHPQMQGPIGVVNGYTTIGRVCGQSPHHGVTISAEDARLIVAAPDLYALLRESQESIGGDWRARRDALLDRIDGDHEAGEGRDTQP